MQLPSDILPFGTLLGHAPGGVPVYCSDYETASEADYPKRSAFRSYVDGIYMGYKWQCVEFARRWMYLNHGYIFDDVSMAYEIFTLNSVREVATERRLPLRSFRNGARRRPQSGSLLIWEEGGEFERTGHVAVVTEVFDDRLRLAEQNVTEYRWPAGRNYSRELRARSSEQGDYWLECSYSDATILGWVTQTADDAHAEPLEEVDRRLFKLQAASVPSRGQHLKSWLNIANEDEAAYVDMMGGHRLTSVEADQYSYYCLSETAREALVSATNELHGMFLHATEYVLANDDLLVRFNLPEVVLPRIRQSWDNRLNQLITSRFDFALSEHGLKVYEYNCDSASCYMESAKIQGRWARHFGVKRGTDAGEGLFRQLVDTWKRSDAEGLVHILKDSDPEETYHALFMKQAIEAAGHRCRIIEGLSSLRWDARGVIRDAEGEPVRRVWKTWAWETALDQIRSECEADSGKATGLEPDWSAGGTPRLVDVLLRRDVMVYEPLWTLLPSNKAILPVLWQLFPNHPLLLNTSFELTGELQASGYVVKPIVGRCGSNIQLVDESATVIGETAGSFRAQDQIYQQLFALPNVGGYHVQACTFTAAGHYAGSGLRVDSTLIVGKASDCMTLRFVPDDQVVPPATQSGQGRECL